MEGCDEGARLGCEVGVRLGLCEFVGFDVGISVGIMDGLAVNGKRVGRREVGWRVGRLVLGAAVTV